MNLIPSKYQRENIKDNIVNWIALRPIRYFWQRGTRGFSDYDAWDFYTWNANVISNIAEDYLKRQWSHPCGLKFEGEWKLKQLENGNWVCDCDCSAEWNRILVKIRDGYHLIAEGEDELEDSLEIKPEVKEAEELFAKYYRSFWL